MPISIATDLARPKAAQVVNQTIAVSVLNPTETDASDSFVQYIQLDDITPDAVTATATADNSDVTLVVQTGKDVRVGDVVSGTGIQVGTVVTNVSGTTVTIDNATTQAITDESLTFTPPETDAKLAAIQGNFSIAGTTLTLRIRGYAADGSTVDGPTDSSTVADMGTAAVDQTMRINLDTFLTAMRSARTNS
jgi:hypothetical protein